LPLYIQYEFLGDYTISNCETTEFYKKKLKKLLFNRSRYKIS